MSTIVKDLDKLTQQQTTVGGSPSTAAAGSNLEKSTPNEQEIKEMKEMKDLDAMLVSCGFPAGSAPIIKRGGSVNSLPTTLSRDGSSANLNDRYSQEALDVLTAFGASSPITARNNITKNDNFANRLGGGNGDLPPL